VSSLSRYSKKNSIFYSFNYNEVYGNEDKNKSMDKKVSIKGKEMKVKNE
jgi:hypothetical protein